MAIDESGWGAIPMGLFDDLEDLSFDLLAVFMMCMASANDHGLFEGRPKVLARRLARDAEEIVGRVAELERLGLIAFYDAPKPEGGSVRVGEIIRFLGYRGQPNSRVQPTRRRASAFPLRDGTMPEHRSHSSDDEQNPKPKKSPRNSAAERPRGAKIPPRKKSVHTAEQPRNDRAALSVRARGPEAEAEAEAEALSPLQGERELHEPHRPVAGKQHQPTAADAPLGGAPPEEPESRPAPRGAPPAAKAPAASAPCRADADVLPDCPAAPPPLAPGQSGFVPHPDYMPADWPRDADGAPIPVAVPDNPGPHWLAWRASLMPPPDSSEESLADKRKRWAREREEQRAAAGYA